jgi:hypothetical protein
MPKRNQMLLGVFVLGIAVGVIGWNFVSLLAPTPAYAEATAGNAGGLIAVTGLCSNNYSGLWVVDTRDPKTSPSVCLYVPDSGGRGFHLAGARRIAWDLQLISWNDNTPRDMSPSRLKKEVEKMNQKEEDKSK